MHLSEWSMGGLSDVRVVRKIVHETEQLPVCRREKKSGHPNSQTTLMIRLMQPLLNTVFLKYINVFTQKARFLLTSMFNLLTVNPLV